MPQAKGFDAELNRIRAGLRAVGERLEEERQAGRVMDGDLARLTGAVELIAEQVRTINQVQLPSIQKSLDKLNGTVNKNSEDIGENRARVRLLEQFCTEQVRPMLTMAQENKLQIAKWGAVGIGSGMGLFGIIELVIKAWS